MRKLLALSCVTLVGLGIVLPSALAQGDPDRVIPGGGISVAGWVGKIDPAMFRINYERKEIIQ